MRRLPVYLLIDTSESMVGPAIESVHTGLRTMLSTLRKDPYTLEMGAMSVITFDRVATRLVPLTEIYAFQVPALHVAPGTVLGAGLRLLDQAMTNELVKTTVERKGDYRPLVFVVTDGQPTDDWKPAVEAFKRNHHSALVYGIGCGEDVDYTVLCELTDYTFAMDRMDEKDFASLFVCMSTSVSTASGSLGAATPYNQQSDLLSCSDNALRRVDRAEVTPCDKQRQVFISCVCQKLKKTYLLRYTLNDEGTYICTAAHKLDRAFSSEEASALEVVSSDDLEGIFDCPYCGAEGAGHCDCGTVMCLDLNQVEVEDGRRLVTATCPTCGAECQMASGTTFDLKQTKG